ncbi:TatD family nuclease-associated radical SAM protein [Ectothiorhodospira haloalkaliphila]|uniref:TatD family nuclease-associated radical SAM protein n=1 Tax=Ectothiorhodospira haloalkaliphila TaxID=421628 RepID=UPI001EE7E41D|nr:TatD family nuclease-associated radical SAM protein [Ectothiorhodospira haloalkaliphila]MCG5525072.1 TatD family nuclease-associated radical SAM protein [Ectothiorhodospira haloalkaliphila]
MQQTANHHDAERVVGYTLHGRRYLNVTHRCTLRCAFCPKYNRTWDVQGYDLRLQADPTVAEMIEAVGDPVQWEAVVFCGLGEPTLRLDDILEVARDIKARGARCVRINTDGLASLVHGRDVTPEMAGCIDALSISLNAQDELTYERHCRPKLPGAHAALLDFARKARAHVPEVTLTAVDGLAGVDIAACEAIARDLGVGFRRRVLDQVG